MPLEDETPKVDIANLLWALAKLESSCGEQLRPLLQEAEAQVSRFWAMFGNLVTESQRICFAPHAYF